MGKVYFFTNGENIKIGYTNNTLNNIYTHTLQNQSVIMTNVINKELMRAIK